MRLQEETKRAHVTERRDTHGPTQFDTDQDKNIRVDSRTDLFP